MKNKVYIEFVGITNSGKTRLMNALKLQCEMNGFSVKTPYDYSLFEKLSFVVRIPRTIAIWTKKTYQTTRSVRGTLEFMRKIIPALAMARSKHRNSEEVLILDEGILHKFRRLRKISRSKIILTEMATENELAFFFPEIPNIVVVIHVEPEIFQKRQQKDDVLFDIESAERQIGKMRNSISDLQVLEGQETVVIHVNSNSEEDLEKAVKQISEKIDL